MTICRKCKVDKPIECFTRQNAAFPLVEANVRRCKSCIHAEYEARQADPEKRSKQLAWADNWKRNNRTRHAELAVEYRLRNKEKTMAQNRLNYAIRKGRIVRQPCEVCGAIENVHGHHRSYEPADWYNVRWLCFECHKTEHTTPKAE